MGNIDYDYLGDGSVAASAVTESKKCDIQPVSSVSVGNNNRSAGAYCIVNKHCQSDYEYQDEQKDRKYQLKTWNNTVR